ncbi:MAG: gliding motility-associated C-terminal domain-containing protein, partial [Flavobacterium sp.]
ILGSDLSLAYADFEIEYGGYNVYQIGALDTLNDYESMSNIVSTLVPSYDPPDFVYLSNATVLSPDSTMVTVEMQPTAGEFQYTLQRYDESEIDWDDVLTLNAINQASLVYYDSNLSTDVFPYMYRVIVTNACGVNVDTTNLGTTILTSGISNQTRLTNTIVWSDYSNWENGVSKYRIYRKIGKTGTFDMIQEIDGSGNNFYEDDVADFNGTTGEFCYMIEAVENPSTLLGTSHSSFSNEICLSLQPVIWVPNCFMVDGFNTTFYPVISFADISTLQMFVYSRWGDIIFQSDDTIKSWDGNMNGKRVQEGTYTYFITVKDGKGKAYDKTGFITMLVGKEK